MRLHEGKTYECTAVDILKFGAVMMLPDGTTQFLHISQIADAFIKDIHDYITVGETYVVKAVKGSHHPIEISLKAVSEEDILKKDEDDNKSFGELLEQYLPTSKDRYYKQDSYHPSNKKKKRK